LDGDGRGQTSVFAARTFAVAANFESRRTAKPNWTRPLAAGVAAAQPWRRQRRTAAAGQCTRALITRTRDPFERSISACEQISSSMSATSISVVGSLQGLGDIAGPDAPRGTVSEFHHMAPIVLFDLHRRSPCEKPEAVA
jgi:hypothetical protein